MIDTIILYLLQANKFVPELILALLTVKVILFTMNRSNTWKAYNLFYFDSKHLLLSKSDKSHSNKKVQNRLTGAIAALVAFQIAIVLISQNLGLHSY